MKLISLFLLVGVTLLQGVTAGGIYTTSNATTSLEKPLQNVPDLRNDLELLSSKHQQAKDENNKALLTEVYDELKAFLKDLTKQQDNVKKLARARRGPQEYTEIADILITIGCAVAQILDSDLPALARSIIDNDTVGKAKDLTKQVDSLNKLARAKRGPQEYKEIADIFKTIGCAIGEILADNADLLEGATDTVNKLVSGGLEKLVDGILGLATSIIDNDTVGKAKRGPLNYKEIAEILINIGSAVEDILPRDADLQINGGGGVGGGPTGVLGGGPTGVLGSGK